MCLSLGRLHVCILFTDLQHYKFLLSRRLLETICWLSIFAKTLKGHRFMMSATHLEISVLLGPYLSVSISACPSHFASVSTPNGTRTIVGRTGCTNQCILSPEPRVAVFILKSALLKDHSTFSYEWADGSHIHTQNFNSQWSALVESQQRKSNDKDYLRFKVKVVKSIFGSRFFSWRRTQ